MSIQAHVNGRNILVVITAFVSLANGFYEKFAAQNATNSLVKYYANISKNFAKLSQFQASKSGEVDLISLFRFYIGSFSAFNEFLIL